MMGGTIRVIRDGAVVLQTVELGTIRQLQRTANGLISRVSGDAVTICHDGKLVCSRSRSRSRQTLTPWKWAKDATL